MKVCLTHVKTFKKPNKFDVKQKFIKKLIRCGMPEEMAEDLMEKNIAIWERHDVEGSVIYAAEVINEPSDNYDDE